MYEYYIVGSGQYIPIYVILTVGLELALCVTLYKIRKERKQQEDYREAFLRGFAPKEKTAFQKTIESWKEKYCSEIEYE